MLDNEILSLSRFWEKFEASHEKKPDSQTLLDGDQFDPGGQENKIYFPPAVIFSHNIGSHIFPHDLQNVKCTSFSPILDEKPFILKLWENPLHEIWFISKILKILILEKSIENVVPKSWSTVLESTFCGI